MFISHLAASVQQCNLLYVYFVCCAIRSEDE